MAQACVHGDAAMRRCGDAATRAARQGRVLVFENNVFLPLSPFTSRLVDALSRALYGEGGS